VYILPASKAALPATASLPHYSPYAGPPFPRSASDELQGHEKGPVSSSSGNGQVALKP